MNTLLEAAKSLYPELKALKDTLHSHPQGSMQEFYATQLLRQRLAALQIQCLDLGMPTGVVGLLTGALPGPVVALRADLDAVTRPDGPAHVCGHDFHTACLWGAARLLSPRRSELRGSILFVFQPGEETLAGAQELLSHGLFRQIKPHWMFALHNRPELPTGEIAVVPGPLMAGKTNFTVTLRGRTGHGGSPHKCVDVIVPGAALVSAIQTIVSRNTDPFLPLVCAVCSIHSGTAENFSPDVLTLTGSIRALSDEVRAMAQERVRVLTREIAAGYQCTAEIAMEQVTPALCNSAEATALARRAAAALVDKDQIVCPRPDLGSEDFAVYGTRVPSFFYWLGTGIPGEENPCWHSDGFRTDDAALPLGAALLAQSALEAMG